MPRRPSWPVARSGALELMARPGLGFPEVTAMNEARKTAALLVLGTSLLLSLGCPLGAQQLTLTPSLANPREWVQGVLRNTNDVSIFYVRDCEVRTLRHSGEFYHVSVGYASPRTVLPQDCDQTLELPPGATHSFFFRAPNDPGSYTVITADLERAAARLDVVAPVVGAQDVCFYPSGMWLPQTAHEVDFRFPFHTTWEFANTGTTAHVFGVSSSIRLFAPGSPTPVATTSLAGVTIPAGRVTEVTLPLVGLPPGPYTVEANFVDASTGSVTTRSGIQPRGARVDLHMHGGREVAPNEQIGMALAVTGFPTTGQDPYYFLLVGFQAGDHALARRLALPTGLFRSAGTGLGQRFGRAAREPHGSGQQQQCHRGTVLRRRRRWPRDEGTAVSRRERAGITGRRPRGRFDLHDLGYVAAGRSRAAVTVEPPTRRLGPRLDVSQLTRMRLCRASTLCSSNTKTRL